MAPTPDAMEASAVLMAEMASDGALTDDEFLDKAAELRSVLSQLSPKEAAMELVCGMGRSRDPRLTALLLRLAKEPAEKLLDSRASFLADFLSAAVTAIRHFSDAEPSSEPENAEPQPSPSEEHTTSIPEVFSAAAELLSILKTRGVSERNRRQGIRFLLELLSQEQLTDGRENDWSIRRNFLVEQICGLSCDAVWASCEEADSSPSLSLGTVSLADALLIDQLDCGSRQVAVRPHSAIMAALTDPLIAALKEPGREPWLSLGMRTLSQLLRLLSPSEPLELEDFDERWRSRCRGLLTAAATSPVPPTRFAAVRSMDLVLRRFSVSSFSASKDSSDSAAALSVLRFLLRSPEADEMAFLGPEKRMELQALLLTAAARDQRLRQLSEGRALISLALGLLPSSDSPTGSPDPSSQLTSRPILDQACLQLFYVLTGNWPSDKKSPPPPWLMEVTAAVETLQSRYSSLREQLGRLPNEESAGPL